MFARSRLSLGFLALILAILPDHSRADEPEEPVDGGNRAAAAIEGNWEGTLKIGDIELRLVVRVVKQADGSFKLSLDSPDQGAKGLPIDTATVTDRDVKLEAKSLAAVYEGRLNEQGDQLDGEWKQSGRATALILKRTQADPDAPKYALTGKPQDLVGFWQGTLAAGLVELRLVAKIELDENDQLAASLDSPDEALKGLHLEITKWDGAAFAFDLKLTQAAFEATMSADGRELAGTWKQRGVSLPLTFVRQDAEPVFGRPQEPKAPFPYLAEDVAYRNEAAAIDLAGTLTIPQGEGPFPAAILISGSGAQDRDEALLGHKPFLVLADHLTRHGIAVLRVDDRGVGGSTGSTSDCTTDEFVGDVLSGLAYLQGRKEIDGKRIGLIGHSEGGLIAPLAASRSDDVAFVVMLAGTAVTGEEILYRQGELLARAAGADEAAIALGRRQQERTFELVKRDGEAVSADQLREIVLEAVEQAGIEDESARQALSAQAEGQIKMVLTPWFRFFLTYDPRPALRQVRCPVLALNGEKDLQVDPKQNLPEIEKALAEGKNADHTLHEFPGLNHLFQTATTGSVAEYGRIEETIAPQVLDTMTEWIVERFGGN